MISMSFATYRSCQPCLPTSYSLLKLYKKNPKILPFGVDVGGVEGDVGGAEVDAGDVEGVVADAVDDVGVGEAGGSRPVVEDPVVDTEHIVVVAACVADQGGRVVVGVGGAAEGTVDTCCAAGGEGIVPKFITIRHGNTSNCGIEFGFYQKTD